MQQAFVNLRSGRPGKLPPPDADFLTRIGIQEKAMLDTVLAASAIGSPEIIGSEMQRFIEHTGAEELMITSQIFDHNARLRSYEIVAGIAEHSS